jgi:hypothetical protein
MDHSQSILATGKGKRFRMNKTVAKSRTRDLDMDSHVADMLAYRLTPDRIACFLLTKQTIDTTALKSEHIERLLNRYPMGYTFKDLEGMDIRLNRNNGNTERLTLESRKPSTSLLTWFQMKHRRHMVKGADDMVATQGHWTIEVWEAGTLPEIPRSR